MNVYYQIQYVTSPPESGPVHSDGCGVSREFLHALLDEWISKAKPGRPFSEDGILGESHFIVAFCDVHSKCDAYLGVK